MNQFHIYVKTYRQKYFKDTAKFCKILGVDKSMWRKIERGINPPPRRIILTKSSHLCHMLQYEEQQMYSLARRWEPSPDSNTGNHTLIHKNSSIEWKRAMLKENTPDYEHKFWRKR